MSKTTLTKNKPSSSSTRTNITWLEVLPLNWRPAARFWWYANMWLFVGLPVLILVSIPAGFAAVLPWYFLALLINPTLHYPAMVVAVSNIAATIVIGYALRRHPQILLSSFFTIMAFAVVVVSGAYIYFSW